MDCFVAEPVIGRAFRATRWLLAMTVQQTVIGSLKIESATLFRRSPCATSVRLAPSSLLGGLNPFRGTSPQRIAMLRAEETEMADPGGAGVGRRDGQDFRFGRGKSRTKQFDGRERRPGIVGQAQRAQRPAIVGEVR